MESPLSIFSPLSFNDEYPLSPFGLEVEPSTYSSFASFSGLAEQLCSSSSPTSSHSSSSYLPPPSSYASAHGSTLDELFSYPSDLSSSDDDFFTPTFSVTDLPSPSPLDVGSEWSYPESWSQVPAPRLSNKASMESLGEWDGVENVPESWTTDASY